MHGLKTTLLYIQICQVQLCVSVYATVMHYFYTDLQDYIVGLNLVATKHFYDAIIRAHIATIL